MKYPTKKELMELVTLCWEVASHVPLEGIPDGMMVVGEKETTCSGTRWNTYTTLLNNLTPKYNTGTMQQTGDFTVKEPLENWQG